MCTAKLLGSKEKMLWYSAKRNWTQSASLGGQDSKPLKSNSLNIFPAFVSRSALVSGDLGPHLMPPLCCSSLVALVPMWPELPSPWGSSSSESGDIPYYFSLLWQHSCCHYTSQCKCSVLSDPGVMPQLYHVGPESPCLTPYQYKLFPSSHI